MPQDTIFDQFGYIIPENLTGLTYEEVKKTINDETTKTKAIIEEKEEVLRRLKFYLSALEYNSRTIWLLYQNDRVPERKVLG